MMAGDTALILVVAVFVGFLIGAVGVGGILLIPPLALLADLSIHQAAATALFTFIFTGLYGAWLFHRRGSVDWRVTGFVCAGAVAFSYLGARAGALASETLLAMVIAMVVVMAGFQIALQPSAPSGRLAAVREKPASLLALGAACGFGSGVTGAGGPLFSVPAMLLMGFPPLMAIGTGQVLQIAAAGAGSLGNLQNGSIDFSLAPWLAAAELAGVHIGARAAHRLNARVLRTLVSALCFVLGSAMLIQLAA